MLFLPIEPFYTPKIPLLVHIGSNIMPPDTYGSSLLVDNSSCYVGLSWLLTCPLLGGQAT